MQLKLEKKQQKKKMHQTVFRHEHENIRIRHLLELQITGSCGNRQSQRGPNMQLWLTFRVPSCFTYPLSYLHLN